jgi:hypothetical protein
MCRVRDSMYLRGGRHACTVVDDLLKRVRCDLLADLPHSESHVLLVSTRIAVSRRLGSRSYVTGSGLDARLVSQNDELNNLISAEREIESKDERVRETTLVKYSVNMGS